MSKLKTILIILLVGMCLSTSAQTYNPSQAVVVNKPIGINSATPTDSRSYYYDPLAFAWRPYQSRAEILSYLNLAKYRSGQFSIIMDSAGQRYEMWFRNGVANSDLVYKLVDTTGLFTNYLQKTLQNGRVWLGNVSNEAASVLMSGDATINNVGALTLANSGAIAGSYPFANVAVDSKGRITGITSNPTPITIYTGNGSIAGTRNIDFQHTGILNLNNILAFSAGDNTLATSGNIQANPTQVSFVHQTGISDRRQSLNLGGIDDLGIYLATTNSLGLSAGVSILLDTISGLVFTGFRGSSTGSDSVIVVNTLGQLMKRAQSDIASGSGITQLTGDATAGPGTGSQALTLATVNSNVGTFTNATVTTNGKGLITAISSGAGGGATNNANVGAGFRWINDPSAQTVRTVFPTNTILWDSTTNANALTGNVDTSVVATQHDLTQVSLQSEMSIFGNGTSLNKFKLVNDQDTPDSGYFYGVREGSKGFFEIEENFLGILYNENSWSNLTPFTNTGLTAAVVANKIQITPLATSTYTATLDINSLIGNIPFTNLQKWKIDLKIKVDEKTATSFGFGGGLHSYNSTCVSNALGRFNASTVGGHVILNGSTDNAQLNASVRTLSFNANDYVLLTVERNGNFITTSIRNITTNSAVIDTSYTYSYLAAPSMPNTGRFSIFAFGGQFTIDSICVSSKEVKNARLGIGGDSKTQGYYASAFASTYAEKLNNNIKTTLIHAGGCDRTLDLSRGVSEIIALRPQQFFMAIGSNDVRNGTDSTTYCNRYDSIVTALVASGIDVYHLLAFYETSINVAPLVNHVLQVYPASKIINTYNPLMATGALNADGIHPNDYGNTIIYNTIIQAFKIYGANYKFDRTSSNINGAAGTIPIFTATSSLGNSSITQNATQVVTTLAVKSAGFTLFRPTAPTNQKQYNFYQNDASLRFSTVNDAGDTQVDFLVADRSGNATSFINFLAPTIVNSNSTSALSITPYAGRNMISVAGTITGNIIPINILASATTGILSAQQNQSTASGAYSRWSLATAGSTSGNPSLSFRDNGAAQDIFIGLDIPTGFMKIQSGNFNEFSGGTNMLTLKRSGQIGIGGRTNPLRMLDVNGSVSFEKDSIPVIATIGSNYLLALDTTVAGSDSNRIKRILPSNLGFATGNTLYTGSGTTTNTTVTISGFLNFIGGEVKFGSATDQGAFTLQNTGSFYQSGLISLNGVPTAGASYKILVQGADSIMRQVALSDFPVLDTIRYTNGLTVRSGTNVDTVLFGGSLTEVTTLALGANNLTFTSSGGEIKIGSTTDRGAYNLQTTGDMFLAGSLTISNSSGTYGGISSIFGSPNYWRFSRPSSIVGVGLSIDTNNNVIIGGSSAVNLSSFANGDLLFATGGLAVDRGLYLNYSVVTTNTTITNGTSYHTVLIDATAGNVTVTLPTVASTSNGSGGTGSVGIEYVFKRIDNSVNVVTILAQGSDLIDGSGSILLATQFLTRKLQSCASNRWMIL